MSNTFDSMSNNLLAQIKKSFGEFYMEEITCQIDREVNHMSDLAAEIEGFLAKTTIEATDDKNVANFKASLRSRTEEIWCKAGTGEFEDFYGATTKSLDTIFESLPPIVVEDQKGASFVVGTGDTFTLKCIKVTKSAGFWVTQLPIHSLNLFKAEKAKIRYWKHVIPLRSLALRHFRADIVIELKKITDLFFLNLCRKYEKLKDWDEAISLESSNLSELKMTNSDLQSFKTDLLTELSALLDNVLADTFARFQLEYDKAGTLELPGKSLSEDRIAKKIVASEVQWAQNNHHWKNTIFALLDEWRSDLDIYALRHNTLGQFQDFETAQLKKMADQIDPEISQIRSFIDDSTQSLGAEHESIQKELKRVNYQAIKKLGKELVPKLCDKLSGKHMVNLINKLDIEIKRNVEKLSNEYMVTTASEYDQPMAIEELAKMSPFELISFETLTVFQEKLNGIRNELFIGLEKTTNEANDLDHIVTFSLASAISSLVDEGKNEAEAVSIAIEGLTRASKRLTEIREKLDVVLLDNSQRLEVVVREFCDGIMELTINENVKELRRRITKAKMAKQAQLVKKQVKENISNNRALLFVRIKSFYDYLTKMINNVGDKFILTANKPIITKQISDFLLSSQEAIDSLPLIYQKLYKIEPLDDMELFEGREEELKEIKQAFESWQAGRFAATMVLGEKWGGLTSFLNFTVEHAGFKCPILRFTGNQNINTEQELIEVFKGLLKNDSLENIDKIVEFIDSGTQKIIILEDIQNLYLRRVGGFKALQLLFQLMTRTYKNVFWVTSTTIHTWSYLCKTVNINEYFSFVVNMQELSKEQMLNIIWKRNRISGFNISFDVSPERLKDKKFSRLSTEERQVLLKEEFFSELNEFAKSNVSLALIFWLLSTKKIDNSTIVIGTLKRPELNVLTALSMDKVYVLHALILHDGLSVSQLGQALNTTASTCRLIMLTLLEDGIVFKKNDAFLINPILYRHAIALLKSKNLIH